MVECGAVVVRGSQGTAASVPFGRRGAFPCQALLTLRPRPALPATPRPSRLRPHPASPAPNPPPTRPQPAPPESLYAAVSVGLETGTIIKTLNTLSKVAVSAETVRAPPLGGARGRSPLGCFRAGLGGGRVLCGQGPVSWWEGGICCTSPPPLAPAATQNGPTGRPPNPPLSQSKTSQTPPQNLRKPPPPLKNRNQKGPLHPARYPELRQGQDGAETQQVLGGERAQGGEGAGVLGWGGGWRLGAFWVESGHREVRVGVWGAGLEGEGWRLGLPTRNGAHHPKPSNPPPHPPNQCLRTHHPIKPPKVLERLLAATPKQRP